MSAGAFSNQFYESDAGDIYSARIQPETESLQFGLNSNVAPVGPRTVPVSAFMTGSGTIGMYARRVRFRFTDTPPGYKADSILSLPIMRFATYTAWKALGRGAEGQYVLGGVSYDVELIGVSPETGG